MAAMLKVTQVRSQIGTKPKTRGTLRALGLRRLGDSNVLPDRPEIRGMIHRVPHLVTVEPLEAEREAPRRRARTAPARGETSGRRARTAPARGETSGRRARTAQEKD